jgi:membrane dipeptidase
MNDKPPDFSDSDGAHPYLPPNTLNDQFQAPLYVDGHVDLPYYMMNRAKDSLLGDLDEGPFTIDKAKRAGVRLFCTALYCEDSFNGEPSYDRLQEIIGFALVHFDRIVIINKIDAFLELKKDPDQIATLFLLENADALAGKPATITQLKEMGIRIVGLTHAGRNRLGDGNAVIYSDGLTKLGREVIRALNDNGLVIDVAHLHTKCFWQLLDLFEGPIVTSHSGIREVFDIPRNIDLNQAGKIFERGGVVGITFDPEMISHEKETGVEHVFIHLDTLVQKYGPDGVGIGSDFCGFDHFTEGLEDITGLRHLMEIMLSHGYGETSANMILGLNWLRIYERIYSRFAAISSV